MARNAKPVDLPQNIDPAKLSKQQQQIYELARNGKTQKEIAEELKTDTDVVKKQLRRIRNLGNKSDDTSAAQGSSTHNEMEGLSEILEELEGRQEEIVREYLQGYRITKIARDKGVARTTVQTYLKRAKSKAQRPEGLSSKVIVKKLDGPVPEKKIKPLPNPGKWLYKCFVEGLSVEDPEDARDVLKAMAAQGLGGMKAKKPLLDARAKHIHLMAEAGREEKEVFTEEDWLRLRPLYQDVLRQYFQALRSKTWVTNSNGLSMLEGRVRERVKILYPNLRINLIAPGNYEIYAENLAAAALLRTQQIYTAVYGCKVLPKGLKLPNKTAEGEVLGVNPNQGWVRLIDGTYDVDALVFDRWETDLAILKIGDVVEIRDNLAVVRKWNPESKVQRYEVEEDFGAKLVARFLINEPCTINVNGRSYDLRYIFDKGA